MPIIENNVCKVGYGSWFHSQQQSDYPEAFVACVKRISNLNLQEGELIRLTNIGGFKVRKITGEFHNLAGAKIYIKQKFRLVSYDITLIDDIEILVDKVIDNLLSNINPSLIQTEIKESIDDALLRGDKKEFIRLTNLLKEGKHESKYQQ